MVAFEDLGWARVLGRLLSGDDLSGDEAGAAFAEILAGRASPVQIAGFAIALRSKGETVSEIAGMVRAMLANAEPLDIHGDLIDTCGTGGDRSGSINVSTAAAFVVAAAGGRVVKHGGRAASSSTGSADVLEALGVAVDLGPEGVGCCVQEIGMGFCLAARFHPGWRFAATVRKELGVATVFNFLGPLANPARVNSQVVGVSDPAMAPKLLGVLIENGAKRAMVVHGADGLDELSTTGNSTIHPWGLSGDLVAGGGYSETQAGLGSGADGSVTVDASVFGLAPATLADLRGGDAAFNAAAVTAILDGAKGPHRDVVVLNAAAGLVVGGLCDSLGTGVEQAQTTIDRGLAASKLGDLVKLSKELAAT